MTETGNVIVMERRQLTDEEWVDTIQLALDCDLSTDLRRRVIEELLEIRQNRKLRFAAMNAQFAPTPPNQRTD